VRSDGRFLRALIEDCCGWNRKTWADAVEFAVSQLPERLDGKKVLEIGAGKYSSIAPIFARKGANLLCSYYGQHQQDIENGQLQIVVAKYGLEKIPVEQRDVYNLQETYDIIVLKSVLGGICRNENYGKLKLVIDRLLKENVRQGGYIVSLDNGHVRLFTRLRNLWGAAKNEWTYFSRNKLLESLPNYDIQVRGFGFINVGAAKFLLHRNIEFVNHIIYFIDKIVLMLIDPEDRAVLSTVIRKI
jgi:hypothetical protein